ncbi:4-hydroxy-3-methylbut-2-enyl diphosphate reductase [Victivallis sp. Marseille-Q1083]|uniref:4-hydroxy-3-methylbut-2-enyl diphosphate reductase n=1 Tax=Victivallis sp. Marseille-Q1083 TaxID=2717288 RepID=UPI00158A79A1|nr:4-hydroxy-3-methylbut-2-enyl diphosphate reductase [Victivallis sp. Marseille-Q1083]
MLRKIYLAEPRGFCAGVRRALECVDSVLARNSSRPLYVLHEIVHNDIIVGELKRRGVEFVESPELLPDGSTLIYSAHGVSLAIEQAAARRHLQVIDASCPLVKSIHRKARRWQAAGVQVILIGHAGHPEVIGTLGQAPGIWLANSAAAVAKLPAAPDKPVRYLTQSTLSAEEVAPVLAALRRRYPALAGGGDICYATRNRQRAVRQLCEMVEAVVVIGSAHSSNSTRLKQLVEICGRHGYLVNCAAELPLAELADFETVGISAGASAPEYLVAETVELLRREFQVEVATVVTAAERVEFPLPDF